MPKLSISTPKYRHHKASGRAVVTICGRDHYLGPHDSPESKVEYDRLVGDWLSAGRPSIQRPETSADEITVAEVLLAYIRYAKGYYVKNGKRTNEVDAMQLVAKVTNVMFGKSHAAKFGPLAAKAVRQQWIDKGQSRPTVNKNMRRLTRIFRWAAAEEMIPGSVVHSLVTVPGLKNGRCESREPAPILPVAIDVVIATLEQLPRVTADMIRFQLLTGARPGEVCRMRPRDIDRTGDVWEYNDHDHKTVHHGKNRTVYIGPKSQEILRPYLDREESRVCFSMSESLEERREAKAALRVTPESCGNGRGRRSTSDKTPAAKTRTARDEFTPSSYRHAIRSACNLAFPAPEPLGMRPGEYNTTRMNRLTKSQRDELREWQKSHYWHPNQLRHTKGTEIRKSHGLEAAQVILGHAAADVTQIYAERDAEKAREVSRLTS